MKSFFLHLSFWLAYILQDSIMMFAWMQPSLPDLSEREGYVKAIVATLFLVVPKFLFTYYLFFFVVKKTLYEEVSWAWAAGKAILGLFVAIVAYRMVFNHYVSDIIYGGRLKLYPLTNVFRLFQAMIDIGFVAGAAVILKLLRIQLASKEQEKNLVKEKLETELKFLRNQTNPHFLFNTLNNIYGLARRKSDYTSEVVMKLSKLLRFMLYESKKSVIRINDELKMLDDYINLEQIRYTERLSIVFDKDIDNREEAIAPLLLLPFVENAFKHGASENRFASFINISIKLREGLLFFTIENTKEKTGESPATGNIGLSNVKRQLELTYREYDLHIDNGTTTFKVQLTINLRNHATI